MTQIHLSLLKQCALLIVMALFLGVVVTSSSLAETASLQDATQCDFNNDASVNVVDLMLLKRCMDDPQCHDTRFDMDEDGQITEMDLEIVKNAITQKYSESK